MKGIAVTDYEAYLETESGQKHFETQVATVILEPGSFLFVPFGCMAAWFLYDGATKTHKGKPFEPEHACVMATPVFCPAWKQVLPVNVQEAVKAVNIPHFTNKHGSEMWRTRATTFTTFFG